MCIRDRDETLIKRYSETRRRHPLASDRLTLTEAITEERVRLAGLAALGHHMDTSGLKASVLREWVRQFIAAGVGAVSYTHLDVYKRQSPGSFGRPRSRMTRS